MVRCRQQRRSSLVVSPFKEGARTEESASVQPHQDGEPGGGAAGAGRVPEDARIGDTQKARGLFMLGGANW